MYQIISSPQTQKKELTGLKAYREKHLATPSSTKMTVKDEYDDWCALDPVTTNNPIECWLNNAKTWPRLAQMALDIFTCPAMSAEAGGNFSMAGVMVTYRRNRLHPETIQACQFVRSWDAEGLIYRAMAAVGAAG